MDSSSGAINANPVIVDVSKLPTRILSDSDKLEDKNNQIISRIVVLSLRTPSFEEQNGGEIPDLTSDEASSTDEELLMETDTQDSAELIEEEDEEQIDAQEIYDLIATISDPEHPLSLAQLAVVNLPDIHLTHGKNKHTDISEVLIKITPTITHCSLATLIGLGIRVRLERCLPPRFRFRILIKEGTHQSENQVNKQLNDKERVAAACENEQLLSVISQMLSTCK
jgi:metal-sulfur cluster biosynthetic enzyme